MTKIWIVWVEGKDVPRFKHQTLESAITEAKRLVSIGCANAYVFEMVGVARPAEAVWQPVDPKEPTE